MRRMATVAAVIFLLTPQNQLVAVSVLMLENRGATNQAGAFSVSIMVLAVGSLLLVHVVLRRCGVRNVLLIR
jgi:iron(III) transport system permease protein